MAFLLRTDPNSLEGVEKQLKKESKAEAKHVKHAEKDFATLEKQEKKAVKELEKAQGNLIKAERQEICSADALNKATHHHEIAISNVSSAAKDLEIKKHQELKFKEELDRKKAEIDGLMGAQHQHNQGRESKLAALHSARAGETPPHSAAPSASETSPVEANPRHSLTESVAMPQAEPAPAAA